LKIDNKILYVIIGIIAFYTIFLVYSDLELVIDKLSNFKIEFIPLILGLVVLNWIVIFYRWSLLLRHSGIKIPTKENFSIFVSGFALSIIPGKAGELIKSQFLKNKFGISRKKTVPIVFLEQLYNLIGLVIVSFSGLIIISIFKIQFFEFAFYVVFIVTGITIFFFIIINSRKIFQKLFLKISKIKFIAKYEITFEDSYALLKTSSRGKIFLYSTSLSVLFWILESIIVFLVLLGFHIDMIEFLSIISTYTISLMFGAVSFLPMGIGVVEVSLVGFLTMQGVDFSLALTNVILIRIFTRWLGVSVGIILLKISGSPSAESHNK